MQAFVPVLTQLYVEESKASVRKFNSAILSLLLLTTSMIALIFILFSQRRLFLFMHGALRMMTRDMPLLVGYCLCYQFFCRLYPSLVFILQYSIHIGGSLLLVFCLE